MATNRIYAEGNQLNITPTASANDGANSGDPLIFGELPGVALDDATDTIANSGTVTAQFDGVFELDVTGADNAGNAAVTAGDIVYYDGGSINIDSTDGTRFGYALEDVSSGSTTTIKVKIGY